MVIESCTLPSRHHEDGIAGPPVATARLVRLLSYEAACGSRLVSVADIRVLNPAMVRMLRSKPMELEPTQPDDMPRMRT